MSVKNSIYNRLKSSIFGVIFAILGIFGTFSLTTLIHPVNSAYAEPVTLETTTTETTTDTSNNTESANTPTSDDSNSNTSTSNNPTATTSTSENTADIDTCSKQVGALGWFICPGTGVLSKAIDSIYAQIEKLLIVDPLSTDGTSPIFQIWQIMRDITNIVFVIVLLIIIYSQITGIGITNYGIKKALPKLIIAAILVNMSYLICAAAVDVSNIFGANIQGIFDKIQTQAINAGGLGNGATITWTDIANAMIGGGAIAGVGIALSGGLGAVIFPFLGAVLCGILSVVVGLFTLGLRQALITMLVMISPLALVCYLLPNTEKWFTKWKDAFISMLVFYPMFSLLYGASKLAGWALIVSSVSNNSAFGIIIGMAVQVVPLFLSISLMKMSNTVLGKVSSGLDNLLNKPKEGIRGSMGQFSELSRQRHANNSLMPSGHLQRYLDARKRKLEIDTENEAKIRKGRAEIWAQRSLLGSQHYDPAYIDDYKDSKKSKNIPRKNRIKTTASTRAAKQAMNIELQAQVEAKNTTHVLGNYGTYHHGKLDMKLDSEGGSAFRELDRAMHVEENDSYADQDWLIKQYDRIRKQGEEDYEYKHYIIGGAGALGKKGEDMVLGQVISKSAQHEAKRKAYTGLTFAKWGYTKTAARDLLVGYAVDDNGLAVDPITRKNEIEVTDPNTGETIIVKERSPGEFLKYHPEYLKKAAYTLKDENGYYYNATDQDGNFIARIYKNDGAALKEILQNWDMPIADPIDSLYGILASVNQEKLSKEYPYLDSVGLAGLSTTIQRATLSSGFKDKAAFAGPMYATSVGQRYIRDIVHLNLARLDNLNKTAKPSNFNTQDAAELGQLQLLMNPENWSWMLFDEQSLRSYRNVNGRLLTGTRYKLDENGNYIKNSNGTYAYEEISANDSSLTHQDLINTVIRKFLAPAAPKFATMMSRITPNILDNQKAGVADNWNGILDSMELWNNPELKNKFPGLINPFEKQQNDTITRARELGRRIRPNTNKGTSANSGELTQASPELQIRKRNSEQRANNPSNVASPNDNTDSKIILTPEDKAVDQEYREFERSQEWGSFNRGSIEYKNTLVDIENLAAVHESDPEAFIYETRQYLDNACIDDDRYNDVLSEFNDYVTMNVNDGSLTTADYRDVLTDLISTFTYEE